MESNGNNAGFNMETFYSASGDKKQDQVSSCIYVETFSASSDEKQKYIHWLRLDTVLEK